MASLTSLISSPPSSTNNIFPKTSQLSAPIGRLQTLRKSQLAVTCKSSNGRSDPFDEVLAAAAAASRRDVLLGLGAGLYGAGAFVTDPFSAAFARPIDGPSQDVCKLATPSPGNPLQIECCPPAMAGRESKPFQFPSPSEPKRIRRPAHLASQDKEYVEKYKLAMKRMKCLPPEDPRSFFQQAKVHCAYCNGSYVQSSHTNLGLQVVQFEVVINDDPDNPSGPSNSEFAGSFLNIPHVHGNNGHNKFVTGLRMDITELLEDIGAENDDQIQVTLVPKKSDGPVTIGGLKIEYSS
ncbi:unnamed protein product [Linum tenue]|uniref:Polyphenol oxidase C-terminal domain-containing protein n=1 Tax=Linum tenue TaxID=586396 RepID=A0AAV0KHE9_9ROSI|nr:unnamed protein product [Linum tenue]